MNATLDHLLTGPIRARHFDRALDRVDASSPPSYDNPCPTNDNSPSCKPPSYDCKIERGGPARYRPFAF
jgi:hypothetical protein